MNVLGILPPLTKDYILSKVTQEQIFEKYLQVTVKTDVLYKAPVVIRPDDDNPTCSFYYSNNGKLRFRDFAGYFWGDCFDVVAHVLRVDSKDKRGFGVILDQIARDFRIHKYADKRIIDTGNTFDVREVVKQKKKVLIEFQPREWNRTDAQFWTAGNIGKKLLEKARVYPCLYIWINKQLVYNFLPKDPAYAYYFGPNDIKVYFPNRDNYRFISNTSYLQGIDLLEPAEIGLITKSYKDVLSLKSFDLQAVAPSSETVPISPSEWSSIKYYCNHWFSLMDCDRTGILMARKLRKLYGIQPLFFANYRVLQKGHGFMGSEMVNNFRAFSGVKDFYDFAKGFGREKTTTLINETKNVFQDRFDGYDLEMYENLKWLKTTKQTTDYEVPSF